MSIQFDEDNVEKNVDELVRKPKLQPRREPSDCITCVLVSLAGIVVLWIFTSTVLHACTPGTKLPGEPEPVVFLEEVYYHNELKPESPYATREEKCRAMDFYQQWDIVVMTPCRITCYGPPPFHIDSNVARCMDRSYTVRDSLDWALEMGLDGICAVSPGTPWYNDVRDPVPTILQVEDHGIYLVVDRTARYVTWPVVDIWVPYRVEDGYQEGEIWSHIKMVTELEARQ